MEASCVSRSPCSKASKATAEHGLLQRDVQPGDVKPFVGKGGFLSAFKLVDD